MKINILLPGICRVPTGGAKVMLEYANRLAADGMDVTLFYPIEPKVNTVNNLSLKRKIRMYRKVFTKKLKQKYSARIWFPLRKEIKERLVPYLGEQYMPDADFTFATAWETAEWAVQYKEEKGEKLYLIQGYEDWSGTREEVDNTWKMPLKKIVIANWLKKHADALGQEAVLINNGLDFNRFHITQPIEHRQPFSVLMSYHTLTIKGSKDGIAALEIVKKEIPELTVTLFSIYKKPESIPDWIRFDHNPVYLKELYNNSAIFISPSLSEGWALPPAEAMQCGCAVVVTDIGGHGDYGINGRDLLLTPSGDIKAMADQIIQLIKNNDRRIAIAKAGNTIIQQFTWEAAYTKLKQEMDIKQKQKEILLVQ
ncbi:glycosyltransferase family 4 protein [Flavisolibacter tropicus]|uniref:Glycosyl transferase family 1 domain-containing protein n=1 Tax=Flavisolibacter tropicus TaxID=1492898 RepID=A0A172TY64_9BACT|nr:glycosyltransferase family 4 protein [Flavisolibacter tropicus]ANE51980.1 hypothetical protein SY85_17250 [Flavisolibacter tropicus]